MGKPFQTRFPLLTATEFSTLAHEYTFSDTFKILLNMDFCVLSEFVRVSALMTQASLKAPWAPFRNMVNLNGGTAESPLKL